MVKNTQILDILTNLDSRLSLNELIEITLKIAIAYLRFNYKKLYKFLRNEDLTIEEFALDSIALLFIKDKSDQAITIKTAFKNWQPKIETEEDALFFLNKIVASRIEQHISSLLREEDPFFSKILDSVNYLIKSQGYIKIQAYGRTFIAKSDIKTCGYEFISRDDFEKIPVELFTDKKSLFPNLLHFLENKSNIVAAIPLNDLIYRLKHINFSQYSTVDYTETKRKQFEIDEIISIALNSSLEKLNKSYFDKGKLNEKETDSIGKALTDICEDLNNGGINSGLYEYLVPYLKDLSKDDYKTMYHNILEYLLKYTKIVIAENLMEKN